MISLAKAHNADRANCTFIASDAAKLPFESGTFDFVFTVLVLQHLPTKKAILEYVAEFIRVVKDGGVISFQLPIAVPISTTNPAATTPVGCTRLVGGAEILAIHEGWPRSHSDKMESRGTQLKSLSAAMVRSCAGWSDMIRTKAPFTVITIWS